jgi:NitT/TauT family transport system permease protein
MALAARWRSCMIGHPVWASRVQAVVGESAMSAIRWQDVGVALVTIAVLTLVWELVVRVFNVPLFLFPPPSLVFADLVQRWELYAQHTWVTLYETLIGFVLAVVLGIGAGILIVYSRWLQSILYPIVVVLQIVPKVAIAPLLLIWLGYGLQSKVVVALLVAFFPIVVTTVTGLRAVEQDLLDLVRVLRGSRWQEFTRVRFPSALPFIFSGLKVAITLAVIGAIIGEFVGSDRGLGYLILINMSQANTPLAFGAIAVLALMSILLFYGMEMLERIVVPWAQD